MKILVAMDGSEHALKALQYAIRMAKLMPSAASIGLVNVHNPAAFGHIANVLGAHAVHQYMDDVANSETAEALAQLQTAGLTAEVHKRHGEIASEIVSVVKEQGCDMLVVGGKGRSGIAGLILGSISTKLASMSPVPVTIVP